MRKVLKSGEVWKSLRPKSAQQQQASQSASNAVATDAPHPPPLLSRIRTNARVGRTCPQRGGLSGCATAPTLLSLVTPWRASATFQKSKGPLTTPSVIKRLLRP